MSASLLLFKPSVQSVVSASCSNTKSKSLSS